MYTRPMAKKQSRRSTALSPEKATTSRQKPSAKSAETSASRARDVNVENSSAQTDIRVFQLQAPLGLEDAPAIDPAFEPLARLKAPTDNWSAVAGLVQSKEGMRAKIVGVVPHDFVAKTGIAGQGWLRLLERHVGKDAYLLNPWPSEEALFPNPLSRAYIERPQLAEAYSRIFEAAGQPKALATGLCTSAEHCIAPYMFATPAFWSAFVSYVEDHWLVFVGGLPAVDQAALEAPFAGQGIVAHETPVTILIARLLPLFLQSELGRGFQALKVSLPHRESEMNAHLQSLRQLKDAAVKGRSAWLARAWNNYRNLYLLQVNGKEWCQRHLPALSLPATDPAPLATAQTPAG